MFGHHEEKKVQSATRICGRTYAKNKDYFEKNECIKTAFSFIKKVVDFMNDLC